MKRNILHPIQLFVFLAASFAAVAQTTNSDSGLSFESFRIITDRNIFDPTRYGRVPNIFRGPRTRRPRVEYFSLGGTFLGSSKGDVAIFTGYNAPESGMRVGDKINGYKIVAIELNDVKLQTSTNPVITLPVPSQIRRTDGGPWTVLGAEEAAAAPAPSDTPDDSAAAAPSPDAGATPTASPGGSTAISPSDSPEEVLKKLRLKRLQEDQ